MMAAPSPAGEWEVESVTGRRSRNGRTQYLLKWKGYSHAESTWEDEAACIGCRALIRRFNMRVRRREAARSQLVDRVEAEWKGREHDDTAPASNVTSSYGVGSVLGKRIVRGRVEYLIRWQNSWERDENCGGCRDKIDAFEAAAEAAETRSPKHPQYRAHIATQGCRLSANPKEGSLSVWCWDASPRIGGRDTLVRRSISPVCQRAFSEVIGSAASVPNRHIFLDSLVSSGPELKPRQGKKRKLCSSEGPLAAGAQVEATDETVKSEAGTLARSRRRRMNSFELPENWPRHLKFISWIVEPNSLAAAHLANTACPRLIPGVRIEPVPTDHPCFSNRSMHRRLIALRDFAWGEELGPGIGYCGELVHEDSRRVGQYTAECDDVVSIDAQRCGNELRFINSFRGVGPEPNTQFHWRYRLNGLPYLAVVCVSNVKRGEEFLLDYGEPYDTVFLPQNLDGLDGEKRFTRGKHAAIESDGESQNDAKIADSPAACEQRSAEVETGWKGESENGDYADAEDAGTSLFEMLGRIQPWKTRSSRTKG